VSAQVWAPPAVTEPNVRTATETAALPTFPSDVAVIIAEPAPAPATSPVAETVATVGSVLAHVTERPASAFPAASCAIAASCWACPRTRVSALGDTMTDVTGAAGGGALGGAVELDEQPATTTASMRRAHGLHVANVQCMVSGKE
jgi:hypothetical protein